MRPTVLPRMRPLISSQHDDRPGTSSGTVPYDLHGRTIRLQAQGFPLLPQPPARANRFYSSHADEAVVEPQLHRKRSREPLCGLKYGPRNTCAVDTFLTLLHHALTPHELQLLLLQQPQDDGDASTASPTATAAVHALHASLKLMKARATAAAAAMPSSSDATLNKAQKGAKRAWYEYLCRPEVADDGDSSDVELVDSAGGRRGVRHRRRRDRTNSRPHRSTANANAAARSAKPVCAYNAQRARASAPI